MRPNFLAIALTCVLVSAAVVAQTASLSGTVSDDADCSRSVGAMEPGIAGVQAQLWAPGVDAVLGTVDDVLVATDTTTMAGTFQFTSLDPGEFRLQLDTSSLPPAATLTVGVNPLDVLLAPGESFDSADFAFGSCTLSCGDCDGSGGSDSIDALLAATFSALIGDPSTGQDGSCDVDGSGTIDVRDALMIAQQDAGFPVAFACP